MFGTFNRFDQGSGQNLAGSIVNLTSQQLSDAFEEAREILNGIGSTITNQIFQI